MKIDMIQNMKKNECVVFNMQLSPDYKFTKNQEKLYSFCYEKDLKTLQEGGEVVLKIGKINSIIISGNNIISNLTNNTIGKTYLAADKIKKVSILNRFLIEL